MTSEQNKMTSHSPSSQLTDRPPDRRQASVSVGLAITQRHRLMSRAGLSVTPPNHPVTYNNRHSGHMSTSTPTTAAAARMSLSSTASLASSFNTSSLSPSTASPSSPSAFFLTPTTANKTYSSSSSKRRPRPAKPVIQETLIEIHHQAGHVERYNRSTVVHSDGRQHTSFEDMPHFPFTEIIDRRHEEDELDSSQHDIYHAVMAKYCGGPTVGARLSRAISSVFRR